MFRPRTYNIYYIYLYGTRAHYERLRVGIYNYLIGSRGYVRIGSNELSF